MSKRQSNEYSQPLKDDDLLTEKQFYWPKKFLSELIGTAFLVFVITGIPTFNSAAEYSGSFEAAFVLTSMIYVFGRISGGHFNPAVTIPMFLRKKITLIECGYYICAQIIGAFIGSICVGLCNKGDFSYLSANQVKYVFEIKAWDYISCFLIEVILTFGFVFVIFASTIKANNFGNLTGLIVGMSLYFLSITGAGVSGGSLNPARSFSPAIIVAFKGNTNPLKDLWLFIIAPIAGGIAAGYLSILFE